MKRFHVHISVEQLDESIRFYSALFDTPPTLQHPDYAKWQLDDPRVNFAISQRGSSAGLDHLGLQVDSADELAALHQRLQAADISTVSEPGTSCCYAESDKHWITDPSGIAWEGFHTLGSIPTFRQEAQVAGTTCCAPAAPAIKTTPAQRCAPGSGCC
ncbi:Glyoxalase-like domain-containing protein [Andreprevotia lacus DSM 23236]|jgi:extradiol dioxygenase family protein|uniref:Glyoxalase-like domain-containing protein n=1 Tax=Andreprevotia lacus DSM 23236 TaxID=1121001 RepID=A0A1W1XPB5_9NEIS|nr:ArsI/CadI family heavy metal resistance metalloenzyme [Andreprevotia lacus]SMC25361.1 Glyoxalase-like domain-containing protein [Andreprevotia lacus DSM 23236]